MVRINRIVTGVGDKGSTRLGDNSEVPKEDPRVEAYGSVDEVNAVLGLVLAREDLPEADRALLSRVQNELFDLGADLCTPPADTEKEGSRLRLAPRAAEALEEELEARNADLPALTSFILPGGGETAARLHQARTVCRRAERRYWQLVSSGASVSRAIGLYLNRLGDLLFVLARANCDRGGEVLWIPGGDREHT